MLWLLAVRLAITVRTGHLKLHSRKLPQFQLLVLLGRWQRHGSRAASHYATRICKCRVCLPPQVEWQDANDPAKGFQYLYLNDADHARLTSKSQRPTLQVTSLATISMVMLHIRITGCPAAIKYVSHDCLPGGYITAPRSVVVYAAHRWCGKATSALWLSL